MQEAVTLQKSAQALAHEGVAVIMPRIGSNGVRSVRSEDLDPLDGDDASDAPVLTTARRLQRLAIVAADVGARFQREGVAHDPVAWLLAPRALFGGSRALEACQDLRGCLRATVLNGLSIGLDADPEDIDALIDDEDGEPSDGAGRDRPAPTGWREAPRLLSAWIDLTETSSPAIHFAAMVTDRPADFARRLVERFGHAAAMAAEIEIGFDATSPRATAFVSEAMSHTLTLADASPESPYAIGLDVVVEQRFTA